MQHPEGWRPRPPALRRLAEGGLGTQTPRVALSPWQHCPTMVPELSETPVNWRMLCPLLEEAITHQEDQRAAGGRAGTGEAMAPGGLTPPAFPGRAEGASGSWRPPASPGTDLRGRGQSPRLRVRGEQP